MKDWLDAQLGKMLLAAALLWAGASMATNPVEEALFPEEAAIKDKDRIQVSLDLGGLATASPEVYFPERTVADYRGSARGIFVDVVKKFEFRPVDLQIPQASIIHAPMLLPSPGPSLQGADKLPRWGKGLPPAKIEVPDKKRSAKK